MMIIKKKKSVLKYLEDGCLSPTYLDRSSSLSAMEGKSYSKRIARMEHCPPVPNPQALHSQHLFKFVCGY